MQWVQIFSKLFMFELFDLHGYTCTFDVIEQGYSEGVIYNWDLNTWTHHAKTERVFYFLLEVCERTNRLMSGQNILWVYEQRFCVILALGFMQLIRFFAL